MRYLLYYFVINYLIVTLDIISVVDSFLHTSVPENLFSYLLAVRYLASDNYNGSIYRLHGMDEGFFLNILIQDLIVGIHLNENKM